jgi:D-arabinose 1-dehydrogenase-like Zn-dependent alcohol dehydrogenase
VLRSVRCAHVSRHTINSEECFKTEIMSNEKIRVGIIGAGGWAKYGHIPALQYLEDFEIIAVSSRKQETAEEYAAKFNILHAFGDEQALITHPDVDLVVILAPAPEHARPAKAAIPLRRVCTRPQKRDIRSK